MRIKTFKEWSKLGYSIKKGSKSVGKNKSGEYCFSEKQVKENLIIKKDTIDYTENAEFWAKVSPQNLYWYLVDNPEKNISEKAGAILVKNLK